MAATRRTVARNAKGRDDVTDCGGDCQLVSNECKAACRTLPEPDCTDGCNWNAHGQACEANQGAAGSGDATCCEAMCYTHMCTAGTLLTAAGTTAGSDDATCCETSVSSAACSLGDAVLAQWAGDGSDYDATIASINAGLITVTWNDGAQRTEL